MWSRSVRFVNDVDINVFLDKTAYLPTYIKTPFYFLKCVNVSFCFLLLSYQLHFHMCYNQSLTLKYLNDYKLLPIVIFMYIMHLEQNL